MPTFHHWRSGNQRNGLFQTAADARVFDRDIIRVYDDLIDGEHFNSFSFTHLFMLIIVPLAPSPSDGDISYIVISPLIFLVLATLDDIILGSH